jgi:hypothetical protein
MSGGPDVPTGHITTFDRAQFERLIRVVDSIDHSLSQQFLKPGADIRLDETLGNRIHIGNQAWTAVSDFTAAATKFGTSIHQRNQEFSTDWRAFIAALNEAKDVFEQANDLASYSAGTFLNDYPDVLGGQGGAPGPGPGPGNGGT